MSTDRAAFGHRDVLHVAVPMILANVSVPLVGIADSAVVGHLDDPTSLAGVAVGATVFSVLFTALNFLRMGTTGLAAQAAGAADESAGRAVLRQGLVVGLVLAVAILVLSRPLESLAMALIAPEPPVALEAARYIAVRIWGAPATLSLFVVGIAILVSLLTGVLSGFFPAWRAARMNPVDALRTGE